MKEHLLTFVIDGKPVSKNIKAWSLYIGVSERFFTWRIERGVSEQQIYCEAVKKAGGIEKMKKEQEKQDAIRKFCF